MTTTIRDEGTFEWAAEVPIKYLDSERLQMTGSGVSATVHAHTRRIRFTAEGGDVRLSLSGSAATATSPWFIPSGQFEWISARGSTTISCYGASSSVYCNIVYCGIE